MRICTWAGARTLLPILGLLTAVRVEADQHQTRERHYYIAAVEINWNYTGNDTQRVDPTYKKVVFREYEKDFTRAKAHPSRLGLLGPTLRAEEGETIVVTFRNMATEVLSIHPHGIAYGKQSEGANYFDNTSQKEKEDDVVKPNGEHVYHWEVTSDVAPQPNDPSCLTYSYVSHRNVVQDYNSGLIGALLICKAGSLDAEGKQIGVDQELVFLFGVFDEKASKYQPKSHASDEHVKYSINGYTRGYLPDVSVCAYSSVSLHLLGMSSEPEVFSVHMNGQVLQQMGHKMSSVGLISGSSATASMVPLHTGRWLLSSHVMKHKEAGMHGFVEVRKCDTFKKPQRRLTIQQKRESREWTYYIAAEEIMWDYAPNKSAHIDTDYKLQYLRQSSTRVGAKYKKAVYTQYKNESFTERLEKLQRKKELGILGPVIRAQIRDVIKIVFKNMASRPYSIYPHGLTIEKSDEGVNYPAGGNQSHGVQPGETYTYVWRVVEEDEPLDGDSRCLTRLYHSAVDTPRDIASGLIGPMLICKSQSLNVRNAQLKADKEQHAMFAVFDENKSWYLDDNIRHFCDRSKVNKADPDFYRSNVMHTINGYVFASGPLLGFCNGEIATWHMSSIGAQDYIQTATVYGHPFEVNGRTEDFLSLYPMTGETITLNMDNVGVWLLASLNSHETTKGMRVKFQDVECFRENYYDYGDGGNEITETVKEFTIWKPPTLDEIKKEDEKPKTLSQAPPKLDYYTDMLADQLGLRSLRNQTIDLDMEKLDLSFLNYDAVDVLGEVTSITKETSSTSDASMPKLNGVNGTMQNGANLTTTTLLNQILSENTTNIQRSIQSLFFPNSSESGVKGTTRFSPTVLPNSYNVPLNSSDSEVDNVKASETESTSIHNVMASSILVNVSTEMSNLTVTVPGNSSSISEAEPLNVTLPGENQSSEESKVTFTWEAVFSYSESPLTSSTGNLNSASEGNVTSMPGSTKNDNVNYTAANHEMISTETPTPPANVSLETHVLHEAVSLQSDTVNVTKSNSSEDNHWENGTYVDHTSESFTNETVISDDLLFSRDAIQNSTSEKLTASDSNEEVLIYLKENYTEVIKSITVKTQAHNWTYEGIHQKVPMEQPDHMAKYLGKGTTLTAKETPKTRRVVFYQKPQKGQGMKTKRRKAYKPQPMNSLPFSPRGFNPAMSPRGARPLSAQPVSDEEELINMPVVIGVPRPDFSNYELYVPGDEPDHLGMDEQDVNANEYEYVSYKDPYSSLEDLKNLNLDETTKYYLKLTGSNFKTYFISAEEVQWDYAGYGQKRQERSQQNRQETTFTKVVFRGYLDGHFRTPDIRGELDEHLGILGPVIKAEVGQSIMVVFRNNAHRPFSLHPNGVAYTKRTEGLSYEDESKYWYKYDNEVQPNTTFTYIWKVPSKAGPTSDESRCRTWAYYSGVNPERDINSGLIGPLLVCREGTLNQSLTSVLEFTLLFMTFDESQSWYYEKNYEMMQRKSRRRVMDPDLMKKLKFHSINGIMYNLKGLRMYTNQFVHWHLINMGSPKDFQSVHFHGQTFLHMKTTRYRQAVYPLLPGSFATLEMRPSKPGLWQLETEIGFNQENGMQTLFLVLDNDCSHPLGLESGIVKDDQITAVNTRGYWQPHLARLNNVGKYNAWSTETNNSWIQVDFQRPVVISQVATQGAWQLFHSQFLHGYLISYSTDRRSWIFHKGDSKHFRKVFEGNHDASAIKKNTFFPPVIARFIRLHPINWYNKATVRLEFYGCELDGCSVPLGMESGLIEDRHITASSTASSWFSGSWNPSLARINKQGRVNAWQAEHNDMNQWLQVELTEIRKITGIVTQGARTLGKEMYVISFTLQYSNDGITWTDYTEEEGRTPRSFIGNTDNNEHVKNYIHPPIFSRLIRIRPKSWMGSITMRVELLGCDFE